MVSPPAAPIDQFTVARIAEVVGRDVRAIREALADRDADGHRLVSGNLAKTYLVSSLPEGLRSRLAELAQARGYDCPERCLARESARWEHPLPIGAIHPEEITRAQKRAAALAPWARAQSEGMRPAGEIRDGASAAHRQALGYEVAADTLDNLMRRVIQRDRGRGEFERWELYLSEMPKRLASADTGETKEDFTQFETCIAGVKAATPSLENRAWAWTMMCDNLQILLETGENPRAARRRLVKHVFARAPWLSTSKPSLAKSFDGKWRRYCAGELFLADQRRAKSGNRQPLTLTDEDEKKLIALSLGGGLAQAWRQLHGEAKLSADVVQRYATNCASKSYVPQRIRDLVTPKVEMLQDIHHGPRQAKLGGAYITRDWSGVLPGDWYQGDDVTLPVYYWDQGPDGKPRAIRGQCLVMIDCRSQRSLAFALHSDNNYNARVIRGLILSTHDTYGMPRRGFAFERGIWKSSRLVTGGERADELTTADTEAGLRDFGVKFTHARLPRAKLVERVLGLLQTRMEHEDGYCGRNEQTEKFERLQRKLQLARAGHIEFSSFLLHRDVWAQRIAEICDAYNNERQDGRLLGGLTPRELWETRFDFDKPLVRLTNEGRYLLANHRRPRRVTKNGLCIQIGNERSWFRNAATGHLIGRTVQVYFNPEDLSSIWLRTSDNARGAVVVPRAPTPAAMDASEVELSDALASCAAHNQAAKTLYAAIAPHFPANGRSHFRVNLVEHEFVEQSREIRDQQAEIRSAQTAQIRQRKQLANYDRHFGRQPGSDGVSPERKLKALELLEGSNRNAHAPTES